MEKKEQKITEEEWFIFRLFKNRGKEILLGLITLTWTMAWTLPWFLIRQHELREYDHFATKQECYDLKKEIQNKTNDFLQSTSILIVNIKEIKDLVQDSNQRLGEIDKRVFELAQRR